MAFHVEIMPEAESFLGNEERVSPALRNVLVAVIEEHIGKHGDFYYNKPVYLLEPESYIFHFDYILSDPNDGRPRLFQLYVNFEWAESGVLRLMYMEEVTA